MNYQKVYDKLVKRAQLRQKANPIEGYKERHHIIPRALGGPDTKDNLVELTVREHFIAHKLLARIYGGGMWYALHMMMYGRDNHQYNYIVTSRDYEVLRKNLAHSVETKAKISATKKGKPSPKKGKLLSSEVKARMSKAQRGKKKQPLSDEHKFKISSTLKGRGVGRKHSDKTRAKMSAALKGRSAWNKGKQLSEEHKDKISTAKNKNRKTSLI